MSAAPAQTDAWVVAIAVDQSDGCTTLVIRGRLGSVGAHDLDAVLTSASVPGCRLRLDLEQVDYISSAGLRVLRDAASRVHAAAGTLALSRVSEPVRLALRLSGPIDHLAGP